MPESNPEEDQLAESQEDNMADHYQQWEYNVTDVHISDDAKSLAERLNSGGEEGWEVVAAGAMPDSGRYRVIRKRPKKSPAKGARLLA